MKTQGLLSLSLLLFALAIFSSCEKLGQGIGIIGQGPVIEQEFNLSNFRNIEVDVDANVYLTQGYNQPVIIKGQSNILDILDVVVTDNTLKINYLESIHSHESLGIFIQLPVLENLSTARGARMKSTNPFGSNFMMFQVYGAGKINMEIDHANMIRSRITGSGQIILEGVAEVHDVIINGSGNVSTSELITQQSTVSITGSGKCEVNSIDKLTVNINGNGKVFYSGNPQNLQSNLSGSGELRHVQ